MTRTLVLDVETTTSNYGHPFDTTNKLVGVACKYCAEVSHYINVFDSPIPSFLNNLPLDYLIIGFNLKFDYNWLRKYGVDLRNHRLWDVQYAHFLITRQREKFPSLDSVCAYYNLDGKSKEVEQYWELGYETQDIPEEVLSEYARRDVDLTYLCYLRQMEYLKDKPALKRLIDLGCLDLHVLADMEWNGLCFDAQECKEKAHEIRSKIQAKEAEFFRKHQLSGISFNMQSGDHLSAFLYGGTIEEVVKVPNGVYKTGLKKGEIRFSNAKKLHVFPRRFVPLKGSELKKQGYYQTDVDTLVQLKPVNNDIIKDLLEISELSKLVSTYYEGIPKINQKMLWEEGMLHGSLNQCVARTGRLSSTSPNLQNLSKKAQSFIKSRW